MNQTSERLGVIAGNGQLPALVLREALRKGLSVSVAAIKEETWDEIERIKEAHPDRVSVTWMGVGQLSKLIRTFRKDSVKRALMVGQVRHVKIFAPGSKSPFAQIKHLPDLKMIRLLSSLKCKNTESLLEAVIGTLESEGISFLNSTEFLGNLLADKGVLTRRSPSRAEEKDFSYGRPLARRIAGLDLGQTIVVKEQAVVAVEAMEGTDATIRRASELTQGEPLTVIKVSRPHQDMRFDVPVIGMETLKVLRECNVTAIAIDAGRTLILDRDEFLAGANGMDLTVVGFEDETD